MSNVRSARRPTLIIIHGMPGTGKTTISEKLTDDLRVPLLGKDALKEFLLDRLGASDGERSRAVGKVTFYMLYAFIDTMLANSETLIVECPFYKEGAVAVIGNTLRQHDARFLEIYCKTDPIVRRRRYIERAENGQRHAGHADTSYFEDLAPDKPEPTQYNPLKLGKLITVDTTEFDEADYARLLKNVKAWLQEESDD